MKRNSHSICGTDWASFVFLSYLSLILHGIGLYVAGSTINQDELTSNFKRFVVQYNRSYVNNPEEYQYRMSVFQDSLNRQALLNQRERELKGKAVYGVNKFSDWTREEFLGLLSKFNNDSVKAVPSRPCCKRIEHGPPSHSSWDWAFASTGVVETQWAIAKNMKSPLDLSIQEFVSCSGNAGCEGGSIKSTLSWLERARYDNQKYYLLPASEYPYEERESACAYPNIEPKMGAQIECACHDDFRGKEDILANYVLRNGSVGVGVDAVLWHDYIGGIIQHHCTDKVIDHAVIIEGFDMSGEIPYWIVRNSWGTDFGIDGYLYIKMNDNICGIAEYVSYVKI